MNSIDEYSKELGIDEKLWKAFKGEQQEFGSIVDPIDDKEAFLRHRDEMANRWFKYYLKCKDKNKRYKLIDQYNKCRLMTRGDRCR